MYDVDQAIRAHVLDIEEPRSPDGQWHPSSLWGCSRKAAYEIRGTEKSDEPTIQNKVVFRVGHLLHDFIQEAVGSDTSVEAFAEVPLRAPDLRIKGNADQLLRLPDGTYELLEYKTINERGFRFIEVGPKDEHRWQALTYMYVLREYGAHDAFNWTNGDIENLPPLGDLLATATIFYLSKGASMQTRTHAVTWDAECADAIRDRIAGLDQYREGTLLPERLPAGSKGRHPLCGYCSFETLCYSEDVPHG